MLIYVIIGKFFSIIVILNQYLNNINSIFIFYLGGLFPILVERYCNGGQTPGLWFKKGGVNNA